MRLIKFVYESSATVFLLSVITGIIGGAMTMYVLVITIRLIGSSGPVQIEIWIFALTAVAAIGSRSISRTLLDHVSRAAIFELRLRFARQIAGAPLATVEQVGNSRLITALTDDVAKIAGYVPNLAQVCMQGTFLFGCLVYLGSLAPTKLAITLVVIAFGMLLRNYLQAAAIRHLRVSREKLDALISAYRSIVDGIKELNLSARRRERTVQVVAERADDVRKSTHKHAAFFRDAQTTMQILFFVVLGLAIIDIRDPDVDRQLALSYTIGIIWMMAPLQGIGAIWQGLAEARLSLNRLEELGLKLEVDSPYRQGFAQTGTSDFTVPFQEIQLIGVRHGYGAKDNNEEFTLGPINLTLRAGEIVFIVGGNGSGKTTLAKLLSGLYVPRAGEIHFNGCCVTDANREAYRQNFSAIFSDFVLFDEILCQDSKQTDELALKLLDRLRLAGRLEVINRKLSATSTLSHGEKKRLALLCSCLEDRPIYIFDEWAAEQDPLFKDIFYREIIQEFRARGKLVIVISHDDRYFGSADRIVLLERGTPPTLQHSYSPHLTNS